MSSELPLPIALLRLIDGLCDAFERGWQADAPPLIEQLLPAVPEQARPALFLNLLRLECDYRQRRNKPLVSDEAARRFAGLGSWAGPVLIGMGLEPPGALLTLQVVAGPHTGQTFRLRGHNIFLLGRGDKVHLSLPNDRSLSRLHLLIEFNPPRACLIDSGGKHGTRLNGVPVDRADLADGDRIEAGATTLLVSLVLPPDGETTGPHLGRPSFVPALAAPLVRPGLYPTIPGYRIEEMRGKGGMGVVYRARQSAGGVVALKTIQPAATPRQVDLDRFQREVAILKQLEHSHIVRYLDSGVANGLLFLAMDFIEGPSLAELLKQSGPLAPARVVALGCQLLDALAFAHDKGYVHRDIKPGNLLLRPGDSSGEGEALVLADFGLARVYLESSLSGLTRIGTGGGTAAFMPPEQVTDFRYAKPPADQYGAAATLYYLLTRQHIYERADSTFDLMRRILKDEPIPLRSPACGPTLPVKLGAVLARALARDPSRRYPDVRAMRQDLAGAL